MLASLFRPSANSPKRGERRSLLHNGGRAEAAFEDTVSGSEESSSYDDDEDEDGSGLEDRNGPLLPIFSSAHLDKIPVYHLQHSIRLLVVQKCETTLSWDQLRSPQISQFLVKPLQQQIRTSHFSRATLYALISNCLQFQKEGQANPGTVGVSKTRAMLCELLAMRFLKDCTTRELIDALFYDFDPLQGIAPGRTNAAMPRAYRPLARISCVEIAIKGQAKLFLSHPLVVQQLEAVWAGNIVFHNAADRMHRKPPRRLEQGRGYGTLGTQPQENIAKHSGSNRADEAASIEQLSRRTVTLYDPSDSSLFKLSRLRVPRYRSLFSTLSFAIMLGLFLAVLIDRSTQITALEILFWFWSAGYMLDEVVGFTEQGFGLYIMSFWNAFDIGILLLFISYYVLRLYGILMAEAQKRKIAHMAYDVLASTAILLFPRLFSVLDHYRYFSQLLIAFRMMAVDLVAILVLMVISCSGFFVAFTLSFSDEDFNAASAAYALFQIVMGFTPAAWELWPGYNFLGKTIMTIFLIICHFIIVTVLITVLTNSFMAVVRNANEEHQFLFAVNTISLVKSDALFSYIAPTNILGWLISPLRYLMPFRTFVKVNRWLIKITHLPILSVIFIYERLILARSPFEPAEFVEQRGRQPSRVPAFSLRGPADLFSPGVRLREPSVTTFHKDRALDEVFRRPFKSPGEIRPSPGRRDSAYERNKNANAVQDWMRGMGNDAARSPNDEPVSIMERLEGSRRPGVRRFRTSAGLLTSRRDWATGAKTVASDPVDEMAYATPKSPRMRQVDYGFPVLDDPPQQTDADGDDELATNDDDDRHTFNNSFNAPRSHHSRNEPGLHESGSDFFRTPTAAKTLGKGMDILPVNPPRSEISAQAPTSPGRPVTQHRIVIPPPKRSTHARNASSATILYSPMKSDSNFGDSIKQSPPRTGSPKKRSSLIARSQTNTSDPVTITQSSTTATSKPKSAAPPKETSASSPRKPIKRSQTSAPNPATDPASKNRPKAPNYRNPQSRYSTPNLATFLQLDRRKPSFNAMALDLASDLGDNRYAPDAHVVSNLPASFGTGVQMGSWVEKWGQRSHHHHGHHHHHRGEGKSSGRQQANDDNDNDDHEEDSNGPRSDPAQEQRRKDTSALMNKMMIERMTNLENGFKDILREVKRVSRAGSIDDLESLGKSRQQSSSRTAAVLVPAGSSKASRRKLVSVPVAGSASSSLGRAERSGIVALLSTSATSAGPKLERFNTGSTVRRVSVASRGKGKGKARVVTSGSDQEGEWVDDEEDSDDDDGDNSGKGEVRKRGSV